MLGVFINPGRRPEQPEPNPRDWGDKTTNRTAEYNPPTDKYARVTLEDLMLALKKDWFYQNVRPKDALTKKGYDLNFTWGIGNRGQKHDGATFPEMMRWLWRDQPVSSDPNNTEERAFRAPAD